MKRLLLVDDDVESLAVARARLADDGIEISCATGGRAGLEAAKSQHPDLILLDLDMPDMTGFDVCRILKADPELCMILARKSQQSAALRRPAATLYMLREPPALADRSCPGVMTPAVARFQRFLPCFENPWRECRKCTKTPENTALVELFEMRPCRTSRGKLAWRTACVATKRKLTPTLTTEGHERQHAGSGRRPRRCFLLPLRLSSASAHDHP